MLRTVAVTLQLWLQPGETDLQCGRRLNGIADALRGQELVNPSGLRCLIGSAHKSAKPTGLTGYASASMRRASKMVAASFGLHLSRRCAAHHLHHERHRILERQTAARRANERPFSNR